MISYQTILLIHRTLAFPLCGVEADFSNVSTRISRNGIIIKKQTKKYLKIVGGRASVAATPAFYSISISLCIEVPICWRSSYNVLLDGSLIARMVTLVPRL